MSFKPFIKRAWPKAPVLAAVLAIALAGMLAASTQALAGTVPPERQAALLHLLRQDCGSCHGMTMKGGLGPGLLPAQLDGKSDDSLVAIILDGVDGKPMPPWRPLLSPGEAAWMVKQLKEGLK
ncbi:MAG: cytochrome c [Rhodospirillales bacterium]|nr:cytochrome c [Rhodospirillales bacterium]